VPDKHLVDEDREARGRRGTYQRFRERQKGNRWQTHRMNKHLQGVTGTQKREKKEEGRAENMKLLGESARKKYGKPTNSVIKSFQDNGVLGEQSGKGDLIPRNSF